MQNELSADAIEEVAHRAAVLRATPAELVGIWDLRMILRRGGERRDREVIIRKGGEIRARVSMRLRREESRRDDEPIFPLDKGR